MRRLVLMRDVVVWPNVEQVSVANACFQQTHVSANRPDVVSQVVYI